MSPSRPQSTDNFAPIADDFGRRFPYVRLSLTDICNFRCTYCLPDGSGKTGPEAFLHLDEYVRLVRVLARLGVWKIRLTGGEPTLRTDFIAIARAISAIPGIRRLAFTTNGYRLPQRAQDYYDAGLRHINISIDSLDPARFHAVTGHDRLAEVMAGMDACFAVGFETVKVNVVLLKGVNDGELGDFVDFVADKPVTLRFIELMRTNDNADYFRDRHLSGLHVRDLLEARGWHLKPRAEGAGPALEFSHPGSMGDVGLIAPYSKDFCTTCNRLRISARGDLHLCLFGDGGHSLRPLLQADDQADALAAQIASLMHYKKSSHFLHDDNSGATPHLAFIGG